MAHDLKQKLEGERRGLEAVRRHRARLVESYGQAEEGERARIEEELERVDAELEEREARAAELEAELPPEPDPELEADAADHVAELEEGAERDLPEEIRVVLRELEALRKRRGSLERKRDSLIVHNGSASRGERETLEEELEAVRGALDDLTHELANLRQAVEFQSVPPRGSGDDASGPTDSGATVSPQNTEEAEPGPEGASPGGDE